MKGLNLHSIVSKSIGVLQPAVDIYIVKSLGVVNIKGEFKVNYGEPFLSEARFQADKQALIHKDNVNQNYYSRKIYITTDSSNPVSELSRNRSKGGDYIYRIDNSSWWLVTETFDEFSSQGWVSVRGVLQVSGPIEIFT